MQFMKSINKKRNAFVILKKNSNFINCEKRI